MDTVRLGVVGMGNMGTYHCNYMEAVENVTLAAICDASAEKLATAAAKFPAAQKFDDYHKLVGSGAVDAILIATPHYQHPDITIAALERGVHVLCEKPAAVTVKQARRMNAAAEKHPHLKFAMNFQMRTNPTLKKLRELILGGDLGDVSRITWIAST